MKVVVNPTWRCPLSCSYCWLGPQGFRPGPELDWTAWLHFLEELPRPLSVDFSGGEPLAYGGLFALLRALHARGIGWAITSNLVLAERVNWMIQMPLPGCLVVNASAHAGSPPDFFERVARLEVAGYPVHINRVIHHDAPPVRGYAGRVAEIPYQAWAEGEALDGVVRTCDAGAHHLVCAPDGSVYPCAVAMQVGREPLGTIAQGWGAIAPATPFRCDWGCSTCYTVSPSDWEITMQKAE